MTDNQVDEIRDTFAKELDKIKEELIPINEERKKKNSGWKPITPYSTFARKYCEYYNVTAKCIADIVSGKTRTERSPIDIQILTPSGFQKFHGVNRYWHDYGFRFVFEDGTELCTAINHKFVITGQVKFAKDIFSGDDIGKVVVRREVCEGQYFYDPLNVENGKVYNHDKSFTSHNTFFGTGDTFNRRRNSIES